MLSGRRKNLKPQDVLLLLKMISCEDRTWRIIDLANELKISPGEITHGLERLRLCGLIDQEKRKAKRSAVLEFIIHGLKYVFPAELGTIQRGIATAFSYEKSDAKFVSDMKYVWATEEGNTKGITISPLYESVPFAAMRDEKLHRLLAMVDSLRIGRVREQRHAKEQLEKELAV